MNAIARLLSKLFAPAARNPSDSSKPQTTGRPERLRIHLRGESHGERQQEAARCRPRERVTLVPQPDNPYDGNAVLAVSARGRELGYIPRGTAARIAHAIAAGFDLDARIEEVRGGEENEDGDSFMYGIVLSVRQPPLKGKAG